VKGTGTAVLVFAVALAACGKKGAPLPPLLRIPAAVGEPRAVRMADEVFVRFLVPTANADGVTPADIARVEVYAVTLNRAPTTEDHPDDIRKLSKLIATEQVRRPLPPLPPPRPGEPPSPPLPPGPGVDQGAEIVVRDTLTEEARAAVTLPRDRNERTRDGETPTPSSLVVPVEAPEPVRYYYAVGVNQRGRHGLVQNFLAVPLGTTSSAPPAPDVTYDERTITIRWKPAPDARGVEAPSEPNVLPSRSLVPPAAPTTYDVYDLRAKPEGNESPSMPSSVTTAPVAALEASTPVGTFGSERCFVVRPVDIVAGIHVRGPASPPRCVTLKDTFPPAPPKALAAVATAQAINLIWDPSDSTDVVGYLVLRSRLPDATLAPAMEEPIPGTAFEDRGVRPNVTYGYVVVAVDRAGNRSEPSNRVEETARQ
jgi:hypothetical protein